MWIISMPGRMVDAVAVDGDTTAAQQIQTISSPFEANPILGGFKRVDEISEGKVESVINRSSHDLSQLAWQGSANLGRWR